uniref:Aminoacylase1 putative n=1 Tax=Albugo laibachii Nc14 TaxID=890382 RepID=F0W437_9STRA|nr:aminoacylase1 putative [Albugo laibachii Nc14]|eukprot:CCA15834.1 aminoacylase1 putative [Albugo laibachii Nc14]
MESIAITRFLELLAIPTISGEGPNGSYQKCALWLQKYIQEDVKVIELVDKKPIVLATWKGSNSSLPCIILNSHYDVVPAVREKWDLDPFQPKVLGDGHIYGRGTQDMKSVCIQYVEAIRRLKTQDESFTPERDIHLLFVPDEEIGGADGMNVFLQSEDFKRLQPIACVFDEGLANPEKAYTVFYGERVPWWLYVKAEGPTGHGSRFIANTATSKIIDICNKALAFRKTQEAMLHVDDGCKHGDMKKKTLGDVTTINLTHLKSGVSVDGGKTYALNVIPTEAIAGFDVRISPKMDILSLHAMLDEWCADEGLSWEFAQKNSLYEHYTTKLDDNNHWWQLFQSVSKEFGVRLETEVFPAATDSRFIRKLGIPAFESVSSYDRFGS